MYILACFIVFFDSLYNFDEKTFVYLNMDINGYSEYITSYYWVV